MSPKARELEAKYRALLHAMQSGVAMKMSYDTRDMQPKHLRVGVNSAMIDSGAIGRILIEKGICTEEEYYEALVKVAQREVDSYEEHLSEELGRPVKLG